MKNLSTIKKENIESAKFMRVVAMLLVVLIHATGVGVTQLTNESPFYFLYLLLNRFTRFEGAVFVFLSGMLLFYNYASKPYTIQTWMHFYKRRFLYILAPFIVWSVFYEWYAIYIGTRKYEGLAPILERIITGDSFYQLYFIFILAQLYFLLPLFIYFVKKYTFVAKHLLLIGFIIELVSQVLIQHYAITLPVHLFLSYIASFLFGGWIALHYDRFKQEWSKRQLLGSIALAIVLGLLYTASYYYRNILGIDIPYLPFKALAIGYYLYASFVLFKAGIYLHNHCSPRALNWTERLRLYSFGFYLVHPFILNIWKDILVAHTEWQFHAFIFLRYIAVCVCCYIFIWILHNVFPKAWFLFGKLPHPSTVKTKYLETK